MNIKHLLALLITTCSLHASLAQDSYSYTVDLNKIDNDQLSVELICPAVSTPETRFFLPRIVPGTYMNSNYGKYVHNLKAFDREGKELKVKRADDNSWSITNAKKLYRITYRVEDTWDSDIDNRVYPMAGTNFEKDKNFVINPPGVFGFLQNMTQTTFNVRYIRPSNFYGATGLMPVESTTTSDLFRCQSADELYDSPIMYSVPDTTVIKVGDADVLVAVYAPQKKATAAFIAKHLTKLLQGTRAYLKGKLPVNKYAFIFYFNSEQKPFKESGAWEHSFSSFYSLEEEPQEAAIEAWIDMAAHEFFHIVTPLTISSREVKQFNFNETHLSKHVWLYEGSTEYASHHMQVWAGLKTPNQFLQALEQKLQYSRLYFKDDLSFTELSTESADKWKDQYVNVYLKGALLSTCIDLILLKSSGGQYGMRELKHDLGVRYGQHNFFEDSVLFREIGKLTYPAVEQFLREYVQGATPVPYEKYFAYAGIDYFPKLEIVQPSTGGIQVAIDPTGKLIIVTDKLSPFGKSLGIETGDELISFQGKNVSAANVEQTFANFANTAVAGEPFTIVVRRKAGDKDITLSSKVTIETKALQHVLRPAVAPTASQLMVRKAWFNNHPLLAPDASPADVGTTDKLVDALYSVISGPAGQRDWNRFRALFHPDAFMGAITEDRQFRKFTPDQYVSGNHPFFMQHAFEEKELLRKTNSFGNVAQVFTTYEYVAGTTPPEKQRGINSVEMIYEKGRWWITSINWDEESTARPIPAEYLPATKNK